jgi:hypothetical protein
MNPMAMEMGRERIQQLQREAAAERLAKKASVSERPMRRHMAGPARRSIVAALGSALRVLHLARA